VPANKQTKYVFVTGGVLSGLGKGITAASLGSTLKARGLKVNLQKCDPYLNVDAGTLNPAEHGECFVTFDGAETDLDLGHYERFLDQEINNRSSLMSGRIIRKVIDDEREGAYLGKTVQIIPHVIEAIQSEIIAASEGVDVHIVEIGGTVGDYEGLSFIEAIREMSDKVGAENCLYLHVVYMPYLETSKEFKTKPAQNAVRELRSLGILPDVLIVRSERSAGGEATSIIEKLSTFTAIKPDGIALLPNARTVYEVPLSLESAGIPDYVTKKLKVKTKQPKLTEWKKLVATAINDDLPKRSIAVVAKYMSNEDTYMSVFEALRAAGWAEQVQADITWVDAEHVTDDNVDELLSGFDGIVIPGGFGTRGLEGKISAASFAAREKMPYLGLCLGMQMAVVALAREAVDPLATSLEIDENAKIPVINLMSDQKGITAKGGTMRLGNYPCVLQKGSLARKLYGSDHVTERHRHRFEFNNDYREKLEAAGMVFSGLSPDGKLVEIVELPDHPFYIASQFHPEFRSRPNHPHPLFLGFVAAVCKRATIRK